MQYQGNTKFKYDCRTIKLPPFYIVILSCFSHVQYPIKKKKNSYQYRRDWKNHLLVLRILKEGHKALTLALVLLRKVNRHADYTGLRVWLVHDWPDHPSLYHGDPHRLLMLFKLFTRKCTVTNEVMMVV